MDHVTDHVIRRVELKIQTETRSAKNCVFKKAIKERIQERGETINVSFCETMYLLVK